MTAEHLFIQITANAGKAIAEFKKVGAASATMGNDTTKATNGLGKLGQIGTAAGGMLKAGLVSAAGAASAALVAFAAKGVSDFAELAASIRDVQRITGGTAEDASKLVAILDDFEVPVETLNKGFFRLSREIGKSDEAFNNAGFSVARNAKGNVDLSATLLNIADAYNATEDPARRATLLTAAFGRGGAELIPILEQGRAGIEAVFAEASHVGQIFTQKDLDMAEEYRLAIDDLHDATQQFSLMAGKTLVPALIEITEAATDAINAIKELPDVKEIKLPGTNIKGDSILDRFTDWAIPIKGIGGGLLDVARWTGLASDGVTDVAGALEEAAEKAVVADKEFDAFTKTLFAAQDAAHAFAAAKENLSDAETTLAKATADYNKLLKDGAVDEKKVADARRSLAEATRSAADADRGLAKAQREYDQAVADAAFLPADDAADLLADSAENLADATDTAASAHERAAAAAAELREAQAGDPEFQARVAAAKENVSDATTALADATRNLGQRSYENELAQRAEALATGAHADQVARLRTELELLMALHPEQSAFLGPILAGLPPPVAAPANPLAGGGLLPGLSMLPSYPATGTSTATTTNNVTVNATTSEADARLIAKEVMWNLN